MRRYTVILLVSILLIQTFSGLSMHFHDQGELSTRISENLYMEALGC